MPPQSSPPVNSQEDDHRLLARFMSFGSESESMTASLAENKIGREIGQEPPKDKVNAPALKPVVKSPPLCCSPWKHCLELFTRSHVQQLKKELEEQIKAASEERDRAKEEAERANEALNQVEQQKEEAVQQKEAAEKERDAALQGREEAERLKQEAERQRKEVENQQTQEQKAFEEENNQLKEELEKKKGALQQVEKARSQATENLQRLKKEKEAQQRRRSIFGECWSGILRLLCCCNCCLPRGQLGDCFRNGECCCAARSNTHLQRNSSSRSDQAGCDSNENLTPSDSIELINKLLKSEWPFISQWFRQQMVELAQPCLQELIGQYLPGVTVSIGTCNLGEKAMQLQNIVTETYKEFKSDNSEIDNLQILGRLDFHSDAQMDLSFASAQVQVSDISIKGEIVIELVQLTHTPPWFSGVRIFSPNVPDVDLKVNSSVLGVNLPGSLNMGWLRKIIIDAITRKVITSFAVLPNRFTINLGDRIDAFALRHPAPRGVLRLAVMKADGLMSSGDTAWSWWRKSEAPTENADPQAVVTLGDQTIETCKKDKTLNPDWGHREIHDLVVTDKEKQKLRIVLRDANYGLFSTKPSDFLGQVDVPVKVLTNCVDREKVLQLSSGGSGGAGAHGQLCLKAQFRELANTAPDNTCSKKMMTFLQIQEWDIGVPEKTGMLLMADIFYASGLPECAEDKSLHWAEVKVSGYRRNVPGDECQPMYRETPKMPGRTAVQHGHELLRDLRPDLKSALPTDTEDDVAVNLWRKRVQISEQAQNLENSGSQLVDVVFDTPFSFLLDSVNGATIQIEVFRSKKVGRRVVKECVGRIEEKVDNLTDNVTEDGTRDSALDATSVSSSASSAASGQEEVARLRWRLQARRLLKNQPKPEEARGRQSWFSSQGCFGGVRSSQDSGPVSFAPEVVQASVEEEQKPEEPAAEAVVEKPAASTWTFWWSRPKPNETVETAESQMGSTREDSGIQQQDILQSEPVTPAEKNGETSTELGAEEVAAAAKNTESGYFSWLSRLWSGKGKNSPAADSEEKKAPADDASEESSAAEKVITETGPAESQLKDVTVEQPSSSPMLRRSSSDTDLGKVKEASGDKPSEVGNLEDSGYISDQDGQRGQRVKSAPKPSRSFWWPSREKLEEPQATLPRPETLESKVEPLAADVTKASAEAPQADALRSGRLDSFESVVENREHGATRTKAWNRSLSASRTPSSGNSLADSSSWPRFSGPLMTGESNLQVPAYTRQATPDPEKVEDSKTEALPGACSGGDSCPQESSLPVSTDVQADQTLGAQNGEGTSSKPFWHNVGRIFRRRGPASSTSPSARSRVDPLTENAAIPHSMSAPSLEEIAKHCERVQETGCSVSDMPAEIATQRYSAPAGTGTCEVAHDLQEEDLAAPPPIFKGST